MLLKQTKKSIKHC